MIRPTTRLSPAPRFAPLRLCCFLLGALALHADGLTIQFRSGVTNLVLHTKDARQQLLATTSGDLDLTREVTWSAEPAGVVSIDKSGRATPVADGSAVITAQSKEGLTANFPVTVMDAAQSAPIHFANQIVPIFTKNGCNGGGCHGKAAGQNGFRLSLLGFEPTEDYEHLVKEARGRRLFPAAPERSLLLTKGTAQLPHGGGKRLEPGSDDYRLLLRWISQGMPVGRADAPTVTRIEVFPTERTLPLNAEQQLVVTAHYSDGTTEDVTRGALFEPNDKDMAATDTLGRVKVFNQPGEVAVMVRYQGKVATFSGTVPLGAPVENLPLAHTFVDKLVFKQLRKVGMPPSEVADDATFLRRVTIDIAGRLPTPAEADALARDASPGKRDAVIDRLLASTDYADYFANTWSALLRNKRADAKQARGTYAFHDWIRDSLAANKPYDQFAREILAASGDVTENPPVAWYRQVRTMQNQLEDTAELFLGLRLQCAQCHHHPYERWSQADYWSFGAFFSQVGYKTGSQPGEDIIVHRRGTAQATNKKNGQQMKPAGLGEPALPLSPDEDPRQALADWLTKPDNRFFARALVNRYWKHFFNRGLVEPEDDMRDTNPATNPELLDALAADFVKSGYDLKGLVRTLTRSTVYQLSATPNQYNARDRHHFARYYPRRLNAEVLYDAVNTMLATESKFDGLPAGTRAVALPDNSFNASSYFLTVFGRPESNSACECERSMDASLSQSLHLLNAKDIQDKLAADASRPAKLAAEAALPDDVKLRDLYRLAYSRDPQPEELKVAVGYVTQKSAAAKDDAAKTKARREAYEDTLWALLNTKEFLFNH
ncbi:MAG TPA: DUF1549 domain-containing protein [Candidatus Limnocylindria bacterium]|jgi:hypothetical protein|nr:DUF1549 domain-containing protein [Candidatus Limnocylindria bacterium]